MMEQGTDGGDEWWNGGMAKSLVGAEPTITTVLVHIAFYIPGWQPHHSHTHTPRPLAPDHHIMIMAGECSLVSASDLTK